MLRKSTTRDKTLAHQLPLPTTRCVESIMIIVIIQIQTDRYLPINTARPPMTRGHLGRGLEGRRAFDATKVAIVLYHPVC